jgi:hypothetical protein
MRSASFAEWLLSLVTTTERASSAVGDLLEDVVTRGWPWFWSCLVRTFLSMLWTSFATAPVSMVVFAVVAWFAYMIATAILWFFAGILMTLGWGLFYFLSHHTGLELLINLLKIRIDWLPVPSGLSHWVEALVIWVVAPLQMGRFTARCWPRREIVAWLYMLLLWPVMMTLIPIAATTVRISLWMIPIIHASTLAGILRERRETVV